VTGTPHCQVLLSHSINTSLENSVPCFQELGPWTNKGINIDGKHLHHLRFADDIVITTDNLEDAQEMLEDVKQPE